jgi:hypothetical protein
VDQALQTVMAVLEFLQTEQGIVLSGGTGAGTTVSGVLYGYQRHHARSLPAFPAHHEALEGGENAGTRFFAAVHDLTMTVTEAWNTVKVRGRSVEEVIKRGHLESVVQRVEEGADELLDDLRAYVRSAQLLAVALEHLGRLWSYNTQDNYRTETYTVTRRDSNGNTRTETKTRQVYVNTDHWFTYSASEHAPSQQAVHAWLSHAHEATFPKLRLHDRRVVLERLDPAQRSFLERLVKTTVTRSEEDVSEESLENIANQWLLGTRIGGDLKTFVNGTGSARELGDEPFQTTTGSEPRYHFVTTSRSHSGPPGYQAIERLLQPLRTSNHAWRGVTAVVQGARRAGAQLLTFASNPGVIESDQDYAQVAVEVYELAFPASHLEMDRLPSHFLTVGAGVGTTAVSLLGYLAVVLLR